VVGYCMTEAGPRICYEHWYNEMLGCCGSCVTRNELKINSPDPENVVGEILFRGEHVMMGYYKNEQATQATFTEDGWMRTGDLGYLDKRNNIYIKGRNKTMILGASGQNIYPEEIEHKLNKQEGVEESIIVEREGKLVGLVFPDEQTSSAFSWEEIMHLMKDNLLKLNKLLPGYSQVSQIEVKKEPFEKTPKNSIKRFLYK
jgi:long-chain acyl-CoA synthetase